MLAKKLRRPVLAVIFTILAALVVSLVFRASRVQAQSGGTMPTFGHVVVVVLGGANYSTSYNSSNMSCLTGLANSYGLGVNYYADSHPSIANQFLLTTGQNLSQDNCVVPSSQYVACADCSSVTVAPAQVTSANNIAYELQQAGKTWKDYVQSLPGAQGCGSEYQQGGNNWYYVRNDPLQYFSNINTQSANYVCISQFAADLQNQSLPNLSWIVLGPCDNGEDVFVQDPIYGTRISAYCSVANADGSFRLFLSPLFQTPYFQNGGDGLLIVVFSEDAQDNNSVEPTCNSTQLVGTGQGCGGQVEMVVISPQYSKRAYQSQGGDTANYNSSYEKENIL